MCVSTPSWKHVSSSQYDTSCEILPDRATSSNYWIMSLCLYQSDKECLVSENWLTDSVITASLRLLKNDHPAVGGLKPTVLAKSKSGFDIQEKDFVQVLL